MATSIKLDGFAELEKVLEGLSTKAYAKGMVKSGLRRAAKPLIKAARDKVMNYSPTVGKSITVNYQSRDGDTIGVGPKRKRGQTIAVIEDSSFVLGVKDPWYAHFIEFGVSGIGRFKGRKTYWLGKSGKVRSAKPLERRRYRADQPARPFMRPAFEETREEMIQNFEKSIWESIEKYVEKHGPKNVT